MNKKDSLIMLLTEDGSATIYNHEKKEHFHSIHGAVQESRHVFIEVGLKYILNDRNDINILEIGFGTGLNALLTLDQIISKNSLSESLGCETVKVSYTGIEPFPLDYEMVESLNYAGFLKIESLQKSFFEMHHTCNDYFKTIYKCFTFRKLITEYQDYKKEDLTYDLVYFDAFSPATEPNLWTRDVFEKLWDSMSDKGVIVTYCSKGSVRRLMNECGFKTERLPGPPGKHEMLRGIKILK